MISDFNTNTIYFSEKIKSDSQSSSTSKKLFKKLDQFGARYKFLPKTNDIWTRDYMPIQVSKNRYIEYRYDPDYLQGHEKGYRNLKTYPDLVCDSIGLKTLKTDIILDGGNLVKSDNCVIMTDKIVKENRLFYSKTELLLELRKLLEVDKIVLIPWDKGEKYGHADGMVRFIDSETILVNGIYKHNSVLLYRLGQEKLNVEFIDFNVIRKDVKSWAYINFLQTKDLILLPKFGIEEDRLALEQIETFYSDYKGRIAQLEMSEIVKHEGALNCITWTTKE